MDRDRDEKVMKLEEKDRERETAFRIFSIRAQQDEKDRRRQNEHLEWMVKMG